MCFIKYLPHCDLFDIILTPPEKLGLSLLSYLTHDITPKITDKLRRHGLDCGPNAMINQSCSKRSNVYFPLTKYIEHSGKQGQDV